MLGRTLDVRRLSDHGQLAVVLAVVVVVGTAMIVSTEQSAQHNPAAATVVRDPAGSPSAVVAAAALRSDVLLVAIAEKQHAATHGGALMVDKLIISGGTASSQYGWDGLTSTGFDPRVSAVVLSTVYGENDQFCLTASSPGTAAVYLSSASPTLTTTRPAECLPPPG